MDERGGEEIKGAEGSARGSKAEDIELIHVMTHPTRYAIAQKLLEKGKSYSSKMAGELGIERKVIDFHLSILRKYKLVHGSYELENPPESERAYAVMNFELTKEGKRVLSLIGKRS